MTVSRNRHHALASLLAAALAFTAGAAHADTQYIPGAEPHRHRDDGVIRITVQPLAPGVYAAKVRYVWTGWVELPDGILLVDASMDDSTAAALADTVRARSGPKPVRYVVNTHAHEDHYGGDRYFVERGATVFAHPTGAALIDSVIGASRVASAEVGDAPRGEKTVRKVERVAKRKSLGPATRRVEIVSLGRNAHTAGDLIVYLPKQKVVFAGDLVSNRAVPWMLDPGMSRTGWVASLDSLTSKAFTFRALVPGHGEWPEPYWTSLRYTRSYLKDAYDRAYQMASEGSSVGSFKDWGYLGPYEADEFYEEVHFMNMRRLFNEARGIKTPGRLRTRAIKK